MKATVLCLCWVWCWLWSGTAMALQPGLPDFRPLVDQNRPAVVNIEAVRLVDLSEMHAREGEVPDDENHRSLPEFLERFFGEQDPDAPLMHESVSTGSGFVIAADGYIVTNHHVVEGAERIVVRFPDRSELQAELIGNDPPSDVALLKVEAVDLPAVVLGNSAETSVGEWVMAIGSPFNFEHSVTAGIVSAKGRSFAQQQYVPFIQTDVPINRGNSGGPLINMNGEVIGVNSQIYSENGSYMGLSFSIPIEVVMSVVAQLRSGEMVRRGLLGVGIEDVDRDLAQALGLEQPLGAIVTYVSPESAAEQAGIQPWDVILAFDGRRVERFSDLPPIVGLTRPGTVSRIDLYRNGERLSLPVAVGELPGQPPPESALEPASDVAPRERFGLELEAVGDSVDEGRGLRVSAVRGLAARLAGFRVGDLILGVNQHAVDTLEAFDRLISERVGQPTAFLVQRGLGATFLVIPGPTT